MPKTFRDLAAANRRNSTLLISAMVLFCIAVGGVLGGGLGGEEGLSVGLVGGAVAALVFCLIGWYGGVSTLMSFHGAQEISKADSPQLFNVVEELAIAGGLPMPRIFIIDTDAPNAFATGTSPQTAAVAITTGLLAKLDRDELQGVMAHELSHVRNFDIRYSMLMATLAGGIVLLSEIVLRAGLISGGRRRSGRDSGNAQIVLLLIGVVLSILAPLITSLIELAMSRQREYLADASAVELTRNPRGLASALHKLSGDTTPMEYSKAAESMFIVNPKVGLRGGSDDLFSTHPPIEERIRRLLAMQH